MRPETLGASHVSMVLDDLIGQDASLGTSVVSTSPPRDSRAAMGRKDACPSSRCTARTSRSRPAACWATSATPRRPASRAACPPTTSRPGASARASPGFAWSFLGAALAATRLPFGIVNAPGQRYHPAIIAQAAATLAEMFPERLWVALGTGEASNEHITGDPWPPKEERNARLLECVEVMRALFAGRGGHPPRARRRGSRTAVDAARQAAGAARRGGVRGDRAVGRLVGRRARHGQRAASTTCERCSTPTARAAARAGSVLQVHLSWAPTEEEAVRIAYDQWRTNVFDPPICWDVETVEEFDELARSVRPEDVRAKVLVSADLDQHVAWLRELADLGFDDIALHHVGEDLGPFIDAFGEHVLPALR